MDEDEKNILYELLINVEWPLEPEIIGTDLLSQGGSIFYRTLAKTPSNIWSLTSYAVKSIWSKNSVCLNLSRIINSISEWHLAVGSQGAVIAILQNSALEIRAKKDDYSSVVGKNNNLQQDPFPSWRKITWSIECSMVAVGYSNGTVEIFNTVGASLFTIFPSRFQEKEPQVDTRNALAALIFSDIRTQRIKWVAELIMVDFAGQIRGYYVSPTEGYQESYTFCLKNFYPVGISAAVDIGPLIIVAGSCNYLIDSHLKENGLGHGLSIWRMINDYPYYKQVPTIDEDEYYPPRTGLVHKIFGSQNDLPYDCIFRISVSPNGSQISALHSSGSISIWDIPSLRKKKYWSLECQTNVPTQHFSTEFSSHSKRKAKQSSLSEIKTHVADVKWWTEKVIILTRFSGAVTLCSTRSLVNLLGEHPEFFEGVPQISAAFDRSFLGLEIEKNIIKTDARYFGNISDTSLLEDTLEETELYEEESSLFQKAGILFKRLMFWITDAERFCPSNFRNTVVYRTGRLLCFKSKTPLELFHRKIDNEEYGEALILAQNYNLDCDLVYQQQWSKSSVTVTSIQDYLSKIRKRSWVLAECLKRVPDDLDAARELILYGLRGTELDTLVAIKKGENIDEFVLSDLQLEYEEDIDTGLLEAQREAEEWAAKDLKLRLSLLSQIDFNNLSDEQIKVIKARQKLFSYFDRLGTYEVLLGGPHTATDRYNPKFYQTFRDQSDMEAAIQFARDANWKGIDALFTYCGGVTLPHRLIILSNFPSTVSPYEYRTLLPECDLSGGIFEWQEDSLRDADWCEDSICRKAVGLKEDCTLNLLYESQPEMKCFLGAELTARCVSKWYGLRARQIEGTSHFVDIALDLLRLGSERNVPDLEELQETFGTLAVLVYEVGMLTLSLEQFEALSDLEKLKLLLPSSTSDTYIDHLRKWGIPFIEYRKKRRQDSQYDLLKEYLISSSTEDLTVALKMIQECGEDREDPIIVDPCRVISVAVDCIYACEKENQVPRAFAILEKLPIRKPSHCKKLTELFDSVDILEDYLSAADLLSCHGVMVTPLFLKKLHDDEKQIKLLLTRLSRSAVRREVKMSNDDWNKLLNDLLELQQNVFEVIEPQLCVEILTEALLTSGVIDYIRYAKELMECGPGVYPKPNPYLQQLSTDVSVRLAVGAAQEYFNSSESIFDANMALARHCLQLIDGRNEEIDQELDLISSLEILPDLGIHKLPLQVRLCENPQNLIKEALKRNPTYHKHGPRILHLADLLRVCGNDKELRTSQMLTLLAEAAFEADDLTSCASWCSSLMEGGHRDGWGVCARLGSSPQNPDLKLKTRLLDFALTFAPTDRLEELLIVRSEVELFLLYEKIRFQFDQSLDSEEGFEDARADSDEEWCEFETPKVGATPSSMPGRFWSATRDAFVTTSSLVSNVANKRLWKSAIDWLNPSGQRVERKADVRKSNATFGCQGCHAFYTDLCPDAHISQLGISYKSYGLPAIFDSAFELSLQLLRISLIEETLSGGVTISRDTTVLKKLALGTLEEDLLWGFSILFLLPPEEAREVLSSIPPTEVSLQVSLYFYSLAIYSRLHPLGGKGISPVLLQPPNEVIARVRAVVTPDSILRETEDEIQKEIKDEIQKETKDEIQKETKDEIQKETDDEIQKEAEDEIQKETKDEIQKETDDEIQKETEDEIQKETDDEIQKETKDEIQKETKDEIQKETKDEIRFLAIQLLECEKVLSDYMEGRSLKRLSADIDIDRFLIDPEYKIDSILGVSMSRDSDLLDVSITLAKKYEVDVRQVYMTHFQFLFDNVIDISDLRVIIQERKLIEKLKDNPEEFVSSMEKKVFPCIDGRDLKKLRLYYSLFRDVTKDPKKTVSCETHLKALDEFCNLSLSLDYKAAISPGSNMSEIFKGLLTAENVSAVSRVVKGLSDSEAKHLDQNVIFRLWAEKFFFDTSMKRPKSTTEWIQRYDESEEIMTRMGPTAVERLIASFAFSTEAAESVSMGAKKEIIKRAAKYCHTKFDDAKVEAEREDWLNACNTMQRLENHLNLLRSEMFKNLVNDEDPKLRQYARQFASSGGDESYLKRLSESVLEEGSSLDTLRSLLSLYPEEAAALPEDVFMEVLRKTLANLCQTSLENQKLEEELSLMDHLLREFKTYSAEGGEFLEGDEILDELRTFYQQKEISLPVRVRVLSSAEEYLDLPEDDLHRLQVMKTGNILSSAFMSPPRYDSIGPSSSLETSQIESEAGRIEFFQVLLGRVDSLKKAQSLGELLNVWPPFSPQVYDSQTTNPWCCLADKCLEVEPMDDSTDLVSYLTSAIFTALDKKQLPDECVSGLVQRLLQQKRPELLLPAAKLALKDDASLAFQNVSKSYMELDCVVAELHYDDELLRSIVLQDAVPKVVPTSLYGPLVTFLSEDSNLELRRRAAKQLESTDHWLEAASLSCPPLFPAYLRTASNALKAMKKWL